ncbi:hypothetical protein D9M71_115930 [compost metagenome]
MAVTLEFLTQDPEEIELATRYWAMDEDGAYLERVADLVPFRDIIQPGLIAKQVRQYCLAYDQNQVCCRCGQPIRVGGRTQTKKTFQRSSRPCEACAQIETQQRREREATVQAELDKRLASHIQDVQTRTLAYQDLPDDVIILLQAIDVLVTPRLTQGTFTAKDCEQLTPFEPEEFVKRLYKTQTLLDDPRAASAGAYFLKDDEVWLKYSQLHFFLPPDQTHGRGEDALKLLTERTFTESEALINFWLDYAVGDVLRYLFDQCKSYKHALEDDAIEKITSTVRHGLRTYSVAQMWFVMWKVVKDAASLASREYYTRSKATATIPNKIRKQLEIADQEGGLRRSWDRPDHHIAGSMGMLFQTLFGIDEYSPGETVLGIFTALAKQASEAADAEFVALANDLMLDALGARNAALTLESFAQLIRAGLTTKDAITETIERNTQKFD